MALKMHKQARLKKYDRRIDYDNIRKEKHL